MNSSGSWRHFLLLLIRLARFIWVGRKRLFENEMCGDPSGFISGQSRLKWACPIHLTGSQTNQNNKKKKDKQQQQQAIPFIRQLSNHLIDNFQRGVRSTFFFFFFFLSLSLSFFSFFFETDNFQNVYQIRVNFFVSLKRSSPSLFSSIRPPFSAQNFSLFPHAQAGTFFFFVSGPMIKMKPETGFVVSITLIAPGGLSCPIYFLYLYVYWQNCLFVRKKKGGGN